MLTVRCNELFTQYVCNFNYMFCIQNREVNNVPSVLIIRKANTKWSVGQHRPPTNAKVGSGAQEE
jgi:hypothetical protein